MQARLLFKVCHMHELQLSFSPLSIHSDSKYSVVDLYIYKEVT